MCCALYSSGEYKAHGEWTVHLFADFVKQLLCNVSLVRQSRHRKVQNTYAIFTLQASMLNSDLLVRSSCLDGSHSCVWLHCEHIWGPKLPFTCILNWNVKHECTRITTLSFVWNSNHAVSSNCSVLMWSFQFGLNRSFSISTVTQHGRSAIW